MMIWSGTARQEVPSCQLWCSLLTPEDWDTQGCLPVLSMALQQGDQGIAYLDTCSLPGGVLPIRLRVLRPKGCRQL